MNKPDGKNGQPERIFFYFGYFAAPSVVAPYYCLFSLALTCSCIYK